MQGLTPLHPASPLTGEVTVKRSEGVKTVDKQGLVPLGSVFPDPISFDSASKGEALATA